MTNLSTGNQKSLVSINGTLTSPEDAMVSVFDRGFLYGDSVYEVTLTYDDFPLLLDEHLDRLWHSATSIFMEIQWPKEIIKEYLYAGLNKIKQKINSKRYYIRIIITRGGGEIGLDPSLSNGQNLIIIFKPLPEPDPELYRTGVDLVVTEVIRNAKKAIDPNVKSGNYLNNVMALRQAREKGAYDAVMLNDKGFVTESTTANIWIILGDKIITPPIEAGLLGGITRASLIKVGLEKGLNIEEQNFSPETLCSADEVFITSSSREILPVTRINEHKISDGKPGKTTAQLHTFYKEFINNSIQNQKINTTNN